MVSVVNILVRPNYSSHYMTDCTGEIRKFKLIWQCWTLPRHLTHMSLLGKLQHYGIDNDILNWVSAFLTCRTQSVVVGGQNSNSVSVESGVLQGTVLGPLLFLLHINNLHQSVQSTVRLFADVCLLYRPIKSVQDTIIIQVTRARNPIIEMHSLVGQVLKEVEQAKV